MKLFGTAICCCFAVAVLAVAQANVPGPSRAINDADVVALPGQVHPLAEPQFDAGLADPGDRMERMVLMLSLRPGAETDLDYLIQQQHDPYSALYHQWLTPDQFGAAFGISDADLNTIVWWLQQHGFTVDEVARGRRWINFTGSVGQVESAFHTEIHTYVVNGELHHANAIPPAVPRTLADLIVGFASLHDFHKKPSHGPVSAVSPDWTSVGSGHYLGPGDFATIYNSNPLYSRTPAIDGTGQTVAVVARSNINHSDPTTFRSYFKLPAKSPNYILNGPDPGLVGGSLGGEVTEADLDVQWSGAIAYNATVDMVISASTQTTDGVDLSAQYIVDHNLAPIMTTSFGLCEQHLGSNNTFYANLWAQAASQGITPFVSSGDSGAAGCDSGGSTTGTMRAVNGLCSPPNGVCVGGTQLMDTSNPSLYWSSTNSSTTNSSALSYIPEQVWNESGSVTGGSGLWSTGGGASTLYPKPSWQVAPGVPADSVRDVPDVSLSAAGHDGYLIYQAGGLYAVGGTSAASPSFASLLALVIQQQGGTRQGNANTVFYPMGNNQYAGSGAPSVFHDIAVANNTVPGVTGYSAVTGFDLATGLGSVNVNNLVLNWGVPGFSVTSGSGSVTVTQDNFVNININTAVANGFSAPTTVSASGLPSGVTASFSPNPLAAPGSGTSVLTLTANASAALGTVAVTVTATGEGISHTTTFSLTVSPTPFVVLNRSAWRVLYVDSQATDCGNYGATNAIDGNSATMWLTEWCNSAPATPHEIQIDLGANYTISGFQYLPRQDQYSSGNIANYEFYVSMDGVNWGTAVSTGTLMASASDKTQKQVNFTGKAGRYVRLRALTEVTGGPWTNVAELNVLGSALATSGPQVGSLTLNPAQIAFGGATSTATVTLTSAPLTNATVTLASSNTAVATVPATVTVNAGTRSANFTVTSAWAVSATALSVINASYNGSTGSGVLTVAAGASSAATIPRNGWRVLYADSQATDCGNYGASNAIDSNPSTMWITEWCNSAPSTPHEIQIDLGAIYLVSGFQYLPRQDQYSSGNIASYEFYVSTDGANWGAPVASGTLMPNKSDKALKQVTFTGAVGRYVRLRALSEVNGGPWTNAAEINVLGGAVPPVPPANWRVAYVDSQATDCGNYGATNAFDGNPATMWITEWCTSAPPPPHEIQIDLGGNDVLTGFQYLPRQDQYSSGNIASYEFYVSTDGANWGAPVASGTLMTNRSDKTLKQVTFTPVLARYVRLRALTEVSGGPWANAAEINLLGAAVTISGLQVATLMLTPASIAAGGNTSVASVTLASAPLTDTSITLTSSNPGAATVPATVTVNAGTRTASFTVTSASAVGATVTSAIGAALNGSSGAATLTVTPASLARIPQNGWRVLYVDSQATDCGDYGATNAFDGNPGTMWLTEWCTSSPPTAHEIQIDLGGSYTISGFQYLPRQNQFSGGNIANYEFFVSTDGLKWGTAVASGTLMTSAADKSQKQVTFTGVAGRFVRLRALSEVNGGPWTAVAELNVLGTPVWSGILAPSRAINWSNAGVTGGIPNRTTICATIDPYVGASDTINNAIATCPSGQVVYLNAGIYDLSTGIVMRENVTLRGAGADQTFLNFAGSDAATCTITPTDVCFQNQLLYYPSSEIQPGGSNSATWTAGYAKGTTQITLSNIGSSGLSVGQYIFLDQANDISDNGSLIICDATNPFACSAQGGSPGRTVDGVDRNQIQIVKITACTPSCTSGSTFTITPGLYADNWRAAKNPGAWWMSTIQFAGLENLSMDHSNTGFHTGGAVVLAGAMNCWIKGVRSISLGDYRNHVWLFQSAHNTVQDSYFYGAPGTSLSYGIESHIASDDRMMNNIFQHVTRPLLASASEGDVYGYNFSIDDYYIGEPSFLSQSTYTHGAGSIYNLFEGNNGIGFRADVIHGTGGLNTLFRNRYNGWESGKTQQLNPILINSYNRYENLIGNVLGQSGVQTAYQNSDVPIYDIGRGDCCDGAVVADDSIVVSTMMRWGNYDTVNRANRFLASEVPSEIGAYANPVPASDSLPPSFFLNAKPSWWGTMPWPAVGPDVTGGDIPDIDGHAYQLPAQLCYDNSTKDADGILIDFNADRCYAAASGPPGSSLALAVTPTALLFGDVVIGNTQLLAITMSNPGTASTIVFDGTVSGTDFAIVWPTFPLALAAGANQLVVISFSPQSIGSITGVVTFTSNAAPSPVVSLVVSGNGSAPITCFTVAPTEVSFGTAILGFTSLQSVTLFNTGNTSLTLSSTTVTGAGYSVTIPGLPMTIPVGFSQPITISFTPPGADPSSGTVTFNTNATCTTTPPVASLTGTGGLASPYAATLNWTASTTAADISYNVYRSTTSGSLFQKINSLPVTETTFVDSSLASGQTYFWVMTAVDGTGTESDFSTEVFATVP